MECPKLCSFFWLQRQSQTWYRKFEKPARVWRTLKYHSPERGTLRVPRYQAESVHQKKCITDPPTITKVKRKQWGFPDLVFRTFWYVSKTALRWSFRELPSVMLSFSDCRRASDVLATNQMFCWPLQASGDPSGWGSPVTATLGENASRVIPQLNIPNVNLISFRNGGIWHKLKWEKNVTSFWFLFFVLIQFKNGLWQFCFLNPLLSSNSKKCQRESAHLSPHNSKKTSVPKRSQCQKNVNENLSLLTKKCQSASTFKNVKNIFWWRLPGLPRLTHKMLLTFCKVNVDWPFFGVRRGRISNHNPAITPKRMTCSYIFWSHVQYEKLI